MTTPMTPPWPDEARYLQMGDVVVDLWQRRLRVEGVEEEIPQRVFDLLVLFMAEPGVLHSRTALFERLWPKTIVEDANLTQNIWLLRRALGEPRKHWVRTVSKGGYCFEPPTPVQVIEATELAPAIPAVGPGAPGDAARPHRRARLAGALLLVAVLLAGAAWWWRAPDEGQALPPPAPERVAVALIEVNDAGGDTRWPAVLLHQWLEWKLDGLPEVSLLTEADLATGTDATPPVVVFLSAGPVADDPGRLRLQARFEEDGRIQRLEAEGEASGVPGMAQALSEQLMGRLVPARRASWPPLQLDAGSAKEYAAGIAAYRKRDWMRAAPILRDVTRRSPRFGLAHLQLARALSHLSDQRGARMHIRLARELLQPAPVEVLVALDAQVLATQPERAADAAVSLARLARQYPSKPEFILQQSAMEFAARPQRALATLQSHDWTAEPLEIRLRHHLQLASVHRALGDLERARTEAATAAAQASAAGANWEMEHALALVEGGRTAVAQSRNDAAVAAFRQAADLFSKAGNQTGTLYARFMASNASGARASEMDVLLAKARAGGNRRLEMEILLREAARHHTLGEMDAYRRRMREVVASAEAAGDRLRRDQFELLLLAEDILAVDLANARQRLGRLQDANLEGRPGLYVVQMDVDMRVLDGDLGGAMNALERATRAVAPTPGVPGAEALLAQLACTRAAIELELGRLPEARQSWTTCASSSEIGAQTWALIGRSETEWLAGDTDQARALRDRAAAAVEAGPGGPDGWSRQLSLAGLYLRSGEGETAAKIAQGVLERVRGTGYRLREAHATLVLAEAAALRGDWPGARQHADEVRALLPQTGWPLRWRADLLDAMAAAAFGERDAAASIAARLHADASAKGDVLALLALHARLPGLEPSDCTRAHREALVARSGLRGASHDPFTAAARP
ncbi:hypothetical protein GCM10027359_13780 [Marilutibacter aestuarii]